MKGRIAKWHLVQRDQIHRSEKGLLGNSIRRRKRRSPCHEKQDECKEACGQMCSGNGVPRQRSRRSNGGKLTGIKRSQGPIIMDIEPVVKTVEHSIGVMPPARAKQPEPPIQSRIDDALARIHSTGRVFRVGQAAATT